jgi:hypothetical protein
MAITASDHAAPATVAHAPAPALQHLGVVGVPGTVGAAVALAASRAAAERRFVGSDPRASRSRVTH